MLRVLLLVATGVLGISSAFAQDAKGLKDHAIVGRFLGSKILNGEVKSFDERALQSAKLADNDTAFSAANSITRSGKITNLVYEGPRTASSIEIAANYRQRLDTLGYKTIYACDTAACSGFGPINRAVNLTFGQPAWGMWSFAGGYGRNPRYVLMERSADGTRSTVALLVGEAGNAGDAPRYALLIVDQAAMATGQITVPTPKGIADAFAAEGSIDLYGVFFDTGSASIKPESAPTLKAIADLMAQEPKLSLIVVGHTDNVGDFAANVKLSQARAAAVTTALTTQHKVAATRLTPFGAGMSSPAASNATEAGRGRNRRVELTQR